MTFVVTGFETVGLRGDEAARPALSNKIVIAVTIKSRKSIKEAYHQVLTTMLSSMRVVFWLLLRYLHINQEKSTINFYAFF